MAETTTVQATPPDLAGEWQCRMSYFGMTGDPAAIEFTADGSALVNSQPFSYVLLPGNVLRLSDAGGASDYLYEIAGDRLQLRYADGSSFECVRSGGERPSPSTSRNPAPGQASGSEWQLQGSYCHWSGSSSSYSGSSYSSTRRLTFDGQGRWSHGSESSFSGSAGSAYGSGGGEGGSYRVQGERILYATDAGEQGVATVNMRQDDGRITEIMLDGELYAKSLCE